MPISRRGREAAFLYLTAFAQAGAYVSLPASSTILRDMGLSPTVYGALFLPMIGAAALAALSGPALASRFGLRGLYQTSLVSHSLMLGILWSTPRLTHEWLTPLLAVGALLLGVALGWMGVVLNATISALFPLSRGAALSGLHATLGVGASLTPWFYGLLIASGRWNAGPLAYAALSVALLLVASLYPRVITFPELIGGADAGSSRPGRRLSTHALVAGLYGVAEATIASWAVLYLAEVRMLGAEVATRTLAAFWFAMTCGRLLAVPLLRRLQPRTLLFLSLFALSASYCGIALARNGTQALAAYLVAGLAAAPVFPILIAEATGEFPKSLARASGWTTAGLMLGLGAGSFMVGPLTRWIPMAGVFLMSSVWPLLLVLVYRALLTERGAAIPISKAALWHPESGAPSDRSAI